MEHLIVQVIPKVNYFRWGVVPILLDWHIDPIVGSNDSLLPPLVDCCVDSTITTKQAHQNRNLKRTNMWTPLH